MVFRGQRGDNARIGLVSTDGSTEWLSESKAGHMSDEARRVEFYLGDEHVLTLEVDFADRGTRQAASTPAAGGRKGRGGTGADSAPDTLIG